MAQNAINYINDGLIFRLDGIDTGSQDASKWIDLVGGIEFTIGSQVTRDGYGFVIGNASDDYNCIGNKVLTPIITATGDATIEAVIKISTHGYIFDGGTSTNVFLSTYNNRLMAKYVRPSKFFTAPTLNVLSAIGVGQERAMINKVAYSPGGEDWWGSFSQLARLGTSNRGFVGTVYALRVYNRMLSESEMLYNQNIDYSRFGI